MTPPDPTTAPAPVSLPIDGTDARFFVRRVYCVGRNYADHAREMGGDPDREPPFYFTKPADAVYAVTEGVPSAGVAPGTIRYPSQTRQLGHEIELVVALGSGGVDIDARTALDHVWGYGVGIDLTRRDLQNEAKELRRPWDLSKGFDHSGPMAPLVSAAVAGHPDAAPIWLDVNHAARQRGDLAQQLWGVADVVAYLSTLVELQAGDLIFTGTPSGVGTLERGDVVTGGVDGVGRLECRVV